MAQLSYSEIQRIKNIANKFKICDGEITHVIPIDGGRINLNFKITVTREDDTTSYMLQRINDYVFSDISAVMENALRITNYLREEGRETLEFIFTKDGKPTYSDSTGVYRMTKFIHAEVFQNITRPEDMEMLGFAVGDFSYGLRYFDAKVLNETIPNFHNTRRRYENLIRSALSNVLTQKSTRVFETQDDLKFVEERKDCMDIITRALLTGMIPTRATHNDTKINNVLFDRKGNYPRCMIDLDTVMPGTVLHDIADAIRHSANPSSEEERDISLVDFDVDLLRAFLKGFYRGAPGLLTEKEIELLPVAIKVIPLELGMRFLADYYDGDKYFRIVNSDDNLYRARVQFALVKKIEEKMRLITSVVRDTVF